jgi:hypothetical protein
MKWVALAVVLFGFVWGLERGWHSQQGLDIFAWPLTGYILGLLAVPFIRLGLRLTGFWYLNYVALARRCIGPASLSRFTSQGWPDLRNIWAMTTLSNLTL